MTAQTLHQQPRLYVADFTIGDSGFSNVLYDVWGTDNNVWAVGTVMMNDTAYGVIKWNGTEWKPTFKIVDYSSIWYLQMTIYGPLET